MRTAIFETTADALFVSFLIMSVDARQDSPMRKALILALQALEHQTKGQREWLAQLVGERSGKVDFSGLTADEVRAQCAMVTKSVRTKLPAPEMHVILARYIPTAEEDVGKADDNTPIKRFYFSQERVDAIIGLAGYLMPSLRGFDKLGLAAVEMMVAKAFAEHSKTGISLRDLEAAFGASHMTYKRAYTKLKAELQRLEQMAMQRLTPYYVETGLVEAVPQHTTGAYLAI